MLEKRESDGLRVEIGQRGWETENVRACVAMWWVGSRRYAMDGEQGWLRKRSP